LLILACAGYLVAAALYGSDLLKTRIAHRSDRLAAGRVAGLIGLALHTTAIGVHCAATHHAPFTVPSESLSATGWAIVVVYLCLELMLWRNPPLAVGAIAYPAAFFCVFSGSAFRLAHPFGSRESRLLDSNLVSLHVIAIVFAFGLFVLAVCCALLYLLENRLLKRKQVGGTLFSRLPPLATIDQLAFSAVALAFPLLTIGLLAGIIRAVASGVPASVWTADARTIASVVTWAFYGAYLWAHASSGWRGLRANYLLIVGLVMALTTYLAPSALHRFG
jgi:ABC-type uncharacterized transport system permease subunit